MTIEERVDKLEEIIPEIKLGIAEIKTILQERQNQEVIKDSNVEKEIADINKKLDGVLAETPKIQEHEKRLGSVEDNQKWLWRSIISFVITAVGGAIVFVLKNMQ